MNRYICVNSDKKVISVRYGVSMALGEIQSDIGESGQIMLEDGTFINDPNEYIEIKPTLEEQIISLQQDNLILMDALASVYEQLLIMQSGGTV